jgi:SAM-dependent methyltransferase
MPGSVNTLSGKMISGRVYPEIFPIDPSERVINFGCGLGPQAVVFKGHYSSMVGVDVNAQRLEDSKSFLAPYGIEHYETICASVEDVPLPSGSFDKAIAIDVIEHVEHPARLCAEAHRLLREGGSLLITFPTMSDRFKDAMSFIKRVALRRERPAEPTWWNPDHHNQEHSVADWQSIVAVAGFRLASCRATTMFPPLHRYGVPRFWFSVDVIHAVDRRLAALPGIRRFGQAMMCVYVKV